MKADQAIKELEKAWDIPGFIYSLRQGIYEPDAAEDFLAVLRSIEISEGESVPKRFLSLIWYLPLVLEWQEERVARVSGDAKAYVRFVNEVETILEKVLGIP